MHRRCTTGDLVLRRGDVAKMVVLCSLGTKDADGKTAVPGCHGSAKFTDKKELRTLAYVEKHGVKRLEELVRAHAYVMV